VRIVAERLQDCYAALGIVHTHYRHLPDEYMFTGPPADKPRIVKHQPKTQNVCLRIFKTSKPPPGAHTGDPKGLSGSTTTHKPTSSKHITYPHTHAHTHAPTPSLPQRRAHTRAHTSIRIAHARIDTQTHGTDIKQYQYLFDIQVRSGVCATPIIFNPSSTFSLQCNQVTWVPGCILPRGCSVCP